MIVPNFSRGPRCGSALLILGLGVGVSACTSTKDALILLKVDIASGVPAPLASVRFSVADRPDLPAPTGHRPVVFHRDRRPIDGLRRRSVLARHDLRSEPARRRER